MKTNSWLLKTLDWVSWISAGMGFIFILLGLLQGIIGAFPGLFNLPANEHSARLFGDTEIVNFFIASTNCFIIAISMQVFKFMSHNKKA